MKKIFILFILGLLLIDFVAAQRIDSVVLATTANYPDAFIAAAAANRIGAPLLFTDKDALPAETEQQINELRPVKVYIIGGPEVISSDVEDYLVNMGYDTVSQVIRLWGITRYGTSAEVAEYFWVEGSYTAVIASDKTGEAEGGNEEIMVMAKDIAISKDAPLLISAENTLPAVIEEALVNLEVKEVILVGFFSDDVKTALENLGITIADHIAGDIDDVQNQTDDIVNDGKGRPLVVIAVGGWQDMIKAPFQPGKGATMLISSEEKIADAIEEIEVGNYSRIKVTGKPELAQVICDAFTAAGIEHDCLTGNAIQNAAQIAAQERDRIRELKHEYDQRMDRIQEKLQERAQEMSGECNRYFELVNLTISELQGDKEQYKDKIREMQQLRVECEDGYTAGNMVLRMERMQQLQNEVDKLRWKVREQIQEEIQTQMDLETKSKKEISEGMQNRLQELAQIRIELNNTDFGEECRERVMEIEQLESEGLYSKVQSRIKVALQECTTAQENAAKGKKTTTTTSDATSTTVRGQGKNQ